MFTLDTYKVSSAISRSIHTSLPQYYESAITLFNHKKIINDDGEGDEDIDLSKKLNCEFNALNSLYGRDTTN